MSQNYTIYGGPLSYFSRKLQAAMIFYGADFTFAEKRQNDSELIETRSGTHQVPVLHTPENWMIADTTPIMRMLDTRFPGREMFPPGPLGILTHILEEYFDEWIARTMVHYRWHYKESAEFASMAIALGDQRAAATVRGWGPRACRATGTESEIQQEQAELEYIRIVEAMDEQLQESRYLLGDRPSAVDCIVLGGLWAHTNNDPTPKKMMANYPRVTDWADSAADWDGSGELVPFPESTTFANFILNEIRGTYLPFVMANCAAVKAGAKAFHANIYGEAVSFLTRAYPEQSRQMILHAIEQLVSDEQYLVADWLASKKLATCFGE